ncbi:oxidoreductase [Cnuibacter physcomitrellae]|uniref:MDR family oxidoreductase n=1 Tax=Cnuibacter physcomitrellae TaxID=1619308 RepID=UPI002175DCCE|nr:MDR family oxidoreductase [Cnuibacter physcomitrellae]MCS5498270.1 oxidoreductase [Cnuibacter physcomitrellae]
MTIRALLTTEVGQTKSSEIVDLDPGVLGEGDVTVRVEWSTVNWKDGSALHRPGVVMRSTPLVGGIDLAGVVERSDDSRFSPGDRVLVNGWALSMTHHGGYATLARVPGDWLVPVPDAFTTRQAMSIGTAGYTAMLAVLALEHGGVSPDSGDVLVTGAVGGVGSIAVALLSALGHRVVASTGRRSQSEYLRALGAAEIIDRAELSDAGEPMVEPRWAAAVDTVGSTTLSNVLAATAYGGVVAACGLAQGRDLPTTLGPFLMRGVTLAGIDSVNAPQAIRLRAWQRLATDLDAARLESTVTEIGLAEVPGVAAAILQGGVVGRTVVDVGR